MNTLMTTYTHCPLCDGATVAFGEANCTRHAMWHPPLPETLTWMRCTKCAHMHTAHYWTEAGLAEVFRNAHANQLAGGSSNPDLGRATWSPVVEKVTALLGGYAEIATRSPPPIWVDVGCGDGALSMTAADFGFMAVGLDARTETVARIQKLGFNAQQGDFMKIEFEGQPDVLSMMDVLEHMPYPRVALQKAASILRPGGVIVISLPDLTCSSWRVMDAANVNPYWMEVEHHHNFSRQRLMDLLRECSFDIVDFGIPNRYKAQMEIYARRRP